MSLPCDVETDCAMDGPADDGQRNKKALQFDPKYRNLTGGPTDRFDSQDSGIDSLRSVDSAFCLSTDSGRSESLLPSISEHNSTLSQRLENIHISSASRQNEEILTEVHKVDEKEEDEAFVDSSTTEERWISSGTSGAESEHAEGSVHHQPVKLLTDDAFDQDQEGDTPLHLLIIHKQEEIVLKFISCTDDPDLLNIRNDLAQTPLHLGVLTRQPHVCRALVLAGAQIDSIDRNGDTPLHIACKLTDDGCIRALTERVSPLEVQRGLVRPSVLRGRQLLQNLELRNFEGFTCIHILGFLDNQEHLLYLVKLGADINAPDGKSGRTALHYSVEMDNLALTNYLIQLRADVDALTYDLCTPLHLAVGRRLKPIVALLMDNMADTDIINFEGDRPCDLSDDGQMAYYMSSFAGDDAVYSDIRIQGQ